MDIKNYFILVILMFTKGGFCHVFLAGNKAKNLFQCTSSQNEKVLSNCTKTSPLTQIIEQQS